jgi:hypothetical protein
MATKEFWSPFDTPTPLDGDQNSSIGYDGKKGDDFFPP